MRITVTVDLDVRESVTITQADDGSIVIGEQRTRPTSEPEAQIDQIKTRWRGQNPSSGAFALVDELSELGLRIVAPLTRKDKQVEPYVRAVGTTASGAKLSAYINTETMSISNASLLSSAASLPGADVRPNGNVHFDVDEVALCVAAIRALLKL